jgi:hypothetical protein
LVIPAKTGEIREVLRCRVFQETLVWADAGKSDCISPI